MENSTQKEGIITRIEQQQRNKKRYNIYIDQEYICSVHEDVLVEQRIVQGKRIGRSTLEQILLSEEKKKAERAIFHYLGYRPRTQFEVQQYLRKKGFHEQIISEVIHYFVERNYINDRQFARQWFTERVKIKRKGVLLLSAELKQKGISSAIIEEVVNELNKEDEIEACYQLATRKIKAGLDLYDRKSEYKLKQYLYRRGFSIEIVNAVYERIIKEMGEIEEQP